MTKDVYRLDTISKHLVRRVQVGMLGCFPTTSPFHWFNHLYGHTCGVTFGGRDINEYGLPLKKLSLWSGESGVGKTRLALALTAQLCKYPMTGPRRVLYVQNEASISDFHQWAAPFNINEKQCYVTTSNDPEEHYRIMLDTIKEVK